jgi:heptosyltransferase-2
MNIAVFWPNWIGDAVMATPAVRALREHFRDARFMHLVRPYVAGVLDGSPWSEKVIHLDAGTPWTLLRESIDLAILFPNSFRSALIAWLGRCRRRVGYRRNGRSLLLTDALEPVRDQHGRLMPSPVLDAYNALATQVGCPRVSPRMDLFTTARDEAAAEEVWKAFAFRSQPGVVCLNPGAAFGAAKHWSVASFARLAQRLVDERGCGILVLCGPAERDLARAIALGAGRGAVHSLADRPLSLGLTKACLRRADLLVTTDSGPRHFAAAFERPVVTLFGPTHIAWTETYFARAIHLQKKVDCGPCQRRVCPLDHRCMKLLTADEVFSAAVALLDAAASVQRAG